MKNVVYEYNFKKPDGTVISETNLVAGAVRTKIIELFKEHYDYNYNATTSALYDLATRPQKINKFVRDHIQVRHAVRPTIIIEQPN